MQTSPPQIDPLDDDLIPLPAAAKLIRPGGRCVAPSTIWRWTTEGKLGVRLPSILIGRGHCTTREAIRWFIAELQRVESAERAEATPIT